MMGMTALLAPNPLRVFLDHPSFLASVMLLRALAAACCLLVASVSTATAQAPPSTDLWLLDLPTALAAIDQPRPINLTDRAGYDNQPHVTPDGAAVLYTSYRDGQTDIYRYDLAEGTNTRLTNTSESEYSPTVMPSGERFSVIRVEADGTQRLWSFTMKGTDPQLVLRDIAPVGYHAWADADRLALFVLGQPATLQLARVSTGMADTLAGNIGRSLLPIPGREAISFVQKNETGAWTIRALDMTQEAVDGGDVTVLAPTLPNREDLAWLPDGSLLMADGTTIYYRTPKQSAWEPLATFDTPAIGAITRLAVHPDGTQLIFVADRPE